MRKRLTIILAIAAFLIEVTGVNFLLCVDQKAEYGLRPMAEADSQGTISGSISSKGNTAAISHAMASKGSSAGKNRPISNQAKMAGRGILPPEQFEYILNNLVSTLPEAEARAWKARRIEGLSLKEAAERIGITRSGVSIAVRGAEKKLRRYLEEGGFEVNPLFAAPKSKITEARHLAVLRQLDRRGPLTIYQVWKRVAAYRGFSKISAHRDMNFLLGQNLVARVKGDNLVIRTENDQRPIRRRPIHYEITEQGKRAIEKNKIPKQRGFESREDRLQWILTKLSQGVQTMLELLSLAVKEKRYINRSTFKKDFEFFKENNFIATTDVAIKKGISCKWRLTKRGLLYLDKLGKLSRIEQEAGKGLGRVRLTPKAISLLKVMKDKRQYTSAELLHKGAYQGANLRLPIKKLERLGLVARLKSPRPPGLGRGRTPAIYTITQKGLDWLAYNNRRKTVLGGPKDKISEPDCNRLSPSLITKVDSDIDTAICAAA